MSVSRTWKEPYSILFFFVFEKFTYLDFCSFFLCFSDCSFGCFMFLSDFKKTSVFFAFLWSFFGFCFLYGAAFLNFYGVFLFFGGFSIFFPLYFEILMFFFYFTGVLFFAIYLFLSLFSGLFFYISMWCSYTFEGEDGAAIW